MKTRLIAAIIIFLSLVNGAWSADSDIRLNSLGFLPGMPKKATITSKCSNFTLKKTSDGETVYSGKSAGPVHQDDVNQDVWIADFSKANDKGKFYLDVQGVGRSIDFEIGDNVYDFAFYTAMRGFYLWRCGTAVEGEHNSHRYKHSACHTEDGYQDYIGAKEAKRDGTGGWHDAGDYGKYTVNAGATLGVLFLAWDHFQYRLKNISLDIPDTAPGYPDFLKELKCETDWLLKMQYPDGSGKVSHKLTRLNFSGFIMPEKDSEKRYFTDWSSAGTADFAAMMAMAARYFKPYDAKYAETCLEAAKKSYTFLKNNPDNKRADLSGFRTGAYQTGDWDDRLWAAAEMWETTGEAKYLKDFEERAVTSGAGRRRGGSRGKIDENWDWGNVRNMGMFTYLLSEREGKNAEILEEARKDLISTADAIVAKGKEDIYGRPLSGRYYWGCNGAVARQTLILQVANKVSANPDYVNTALDIAGHLFGRNYYGRSYVTGLGHQPPLNPHDRRSGSDDIQEPWPGYLVGGGHSARGWNDAQKDYRTNEIAVNWQSALVYTLAGFVDAQTSAVAGENIQTAKRKPDVIFVPTPQAVVDKMLEMAEVKKGDVLYDLGCGDGRIVVTAAKRYGVKAVGFDIDPKRIRESLLNVKSNKVEHLVTIKQEDIFTLDLREASVVTLYLLPTLNVKLMPQLARLKPGSRIVSHDFDMRGAKPMQIHRMTLSGRDLDKEPEEVVEEDLGEETEEDFGEIFEEVFDEELDEIYWDTRHTIYKWVVPWETETTTSTDQE
jgi:endoglucanase